VCVCVFAHARMRNSKHSPTLKICMPGSPGSFSWGAHSSSWEWQFLPPVVPWLIHKSAMTHSYVCHDSFTCVPWLIHMSAMTPSYVCMTHSYIQRHSAAAPAVSASHCAMMHSYIWHDLFTRVTRPYCHDSSYLWTTHLYACQDSCSQCLPHPHFLLRAVPLLIHTCTMTHSHVYHDSFVPVPWLTYNGLRYYAEAPALFPFYCAMNYSYVCHDSFICVHDSLIRTSWVRSCTRSLCLLLCHVAIMCVLGLIHMCAMICVPWLMCGMTHSCVCHDIVVP